MGVGQRSKFTLTMLVTGVNGAKAGLNCDYQRARLLIVQCGGLGAVRLFTWNLSFPTKSRWKLQGVRWLSLGSHKKSFLLHSIG